MPLADDTVAEQTNQAMVDRMIAEGALYSDAVIKAFRATPRHRFIDRIFQFDRQKGQWQERIADTTSLQWLSLVYSDRALTTAIGGNTSDALPVSSSSQPSLMGQMLQDMRLSPGHRVLEIGAGTGYNAALLAHIVAPGEVISIDVDPDVLSRAWANLRAFPERRIRLHPADGRAGFPAEAPFDCIIVTAATNDLEPAWLQQVKDGGVLLVPLVISPGLEYIVCGRVEGGIFHGRITRAAYFMPLRGAGEGRRRDDSTTFARQCQQTTTAPWANWFQRRITRLGWLGFIQSLALFSWLHGCNIYYDAQEEGVGEYIIEDSPSGEWCRFSKEKWQTSGQGGAALAQRLWRAFLDVGGPWPTEYDIQAAPKLPLPTEANVFFQCGPRCHRTWRIRDQRNRPGWL
ncbi:MAG: hypothetical protein KatS3mg105_0025 [Gemmatales bacterium]|nr:MAG: hypothetical protein KatS3mg105_0025 [Gemmatales bacterium]